MRRGRAPWPPIVALCTLLVSLSSHAGGDPEAMEAPPPATPASPAPAAPSAPEAAAPSEPQQEAPQSPPPNALVVGAFSAAGGELPADWEPLEFDNIPAHTRYTPEQQEGQWIVRADADSSASGLIRRLEVDLERYPILRWRWKVERALSAGDVTRKSGDDYAARIYVAFKYEPERVGLFKRAQYLAGRAIFGDIPIGALNYIWASRAEPGEVYDNPYAGSFVRMIPVRSGDARTGEWIEERRDVYADYKRAFGEEPPPVQGVAIMTDTDNTGEKATARYGDIWFLPARQAAIPPDMTERSEPLEPGS